MKYAFIEEQRTQHRVQRLCRVLGVSRAGFYEWRDRHPSLRAQADADLQATIVQLHTESRGTYGRPRVHAKLAASGVHVGRKRVGRLMKTAGIAGIQPRRFSKTTNSAHDLPIALNLLDRKFGIAEIGGTNRAWAGDVTYIPTREGWLYLAVVLDLFSRRVIGWSMKTTMQYELVGDALRTAIQSRRPPRGTIFHSDRGSQYASEGYRTLLAEHGLKASMSRKGDCWDNAPVESFFGTLKTELRDPIWETRAAARAAIFEYIEVWYNRRRLHSTIGYVSPEQYESSLPIAA